MSESVIVRNFTCVCGTLPEVVVEKRRYTTGDLALYVHMRAGERLETLLVASCLVPGIPEGCVAIKDFAENRGVLLALARAGVIDDPHTYIQGIPICRVRI